jgi:hypothetical protein
MYEYHIYSNYEIKSVVCLHRCHSANGSENHHTFTRKNCMAPRSKNLPEESIKKEHITGFQWSVRLLGLQPKDFGINKKSVLQNLVKVLWLSQFICAWVEVDTKLVLMKHFIAGFYQPFTSLTSFCLKHLQSVMQDHIGHGQSTFGGVCFCK